MAYGAYVRRVDGSETDYWGIPMLFTLVYSGEFHAGRDTDGVFTAVGSFNPAAVYSYRVAQKSSLGSSTFGNYVILCDDIKVYTDRITFAWRTATLYWPDACIFEVYEVLI